MQKMLPQPKVPAKRMVIGLVIAVLGGPFLTALLPYVPCGVLLTFLFAFAGFVPFLVCALLQLAIYSVLGGTPVAILGLLASVLPAAIAVRGVRWKRPFAEQIRINLIAQLLGIVAALGFAYTQYGSIIAKIMEVLRTQLESYPSELLEMVMQGRMTDLDELMTMVQSNMALQLPGMLLTMSIFGAVLMTALPNWLLRRRGETNPVCYDVLAKWRVPNSIVAGMLGMLVVSVILYFNGLRGGDSVMMAVRSICDTCFVIQAMGAIARLFQRTGSSRGWRNACVILGATLLQTLATYLGCFSALFGSRGLVTELIRKYRAKHRDD